MEWLRTGVGEMVTIVDEGSSIEKEHLCERVCVVCNNAKLSQTRFAEGLWISAYHIKAIEMGRASASEVLVRQIATKYHVSLEWLRTGNGQITESAEEVATRKKSSEIAEIMDYVRSSPKARCAILDAIRSGVWN